MRYISCVLFVCIGYLAAAQYSFPDNGILFNDNEVPQIDIYLDPDDLSTILDPSNADEDIEYNATFIFSSSQLIDTIENVGFRLRGNTSRSADKKSFKVSFNSFERGRKFQGVEKLNLNGEHNDPSIIRSKIGWDLFRYAEIPASRANHVALYINDEYRGLYINVEHVDEEFVQKRFCNDEGNLWKCLWPADLQYKSDNPLDYAEPESWGRRAYQLQTNEDAFDYTKLAHFINVLNNYQGQEFKCELERIFDVDAYLRTIVVDVLISNWDGPIVNKNNFYLYHNPKTDRISYIPYDLDNTFGIDWFDVNWATTDIYDWSKYSGEYRPIYDELMAIPEYRDRYSYYMDQFMTEYFTSSRMAMYLDEKRAMISPYRINDTYAEDDYGYGYDDFVDSYENGLWGHIEIGLKPYINTRINVISSQLELNAIPPNVKELYVLWSEELVQFFGQVYDDEEVTEIIFHYSIQGEAWEEIPVTNLESDGFMHDFTVNQLGEMLYYFELMDDSGGVTYYPNCQDGKVQLGYGDTPSIVINELMASNETKVQDGAGEYEDWIELFNTAGQGIDLSKLYLSDDPNNLTKWKLPSRFLKPGAYNTLWMDGDTHQGNKHANFKLSKNGEFLGLFDGHDNNYAPIDTLTFPPQETDVAYARLPNGAGGFQEAAYMTYGYNNEYPSASKEHDLHSWEIYPNPSSNFIYLNPFYDVFGYELFSVNGDFVFKGDKPILDVSDLNAGIYFVKVYGIDGRMSVDSFVKI